MSEQAILCVDDEPLILESLKRQLIRHFGDQYRIEIAESGNDALMLMDELFQIGIDIPLLISDYIMPGMKGDELLKTVHSRHPRMLKIFLTGRADADAVGNVVNRAALYRYISKPWEPNDLNMTISEALRSYSQERRLEQQQVKLQQLYDEAQKEIAMRKNAEHGLQKALSEVERLKNRFQAETVYLREEIKSEHNFNEIIGRSEPLKKVLTRLEQVAKTDASVLILGETGTGKELIARAIHNGSPRNHHPLVKVNCAAMPANLIESELFGHEKGAFTGAMSKKIGRFEFADGGTIFLDEIGDLPMELQPKLLRALQEGEIERLGNSQPISVNVRVIAATNRNLKQAIEDTHFRKDLFFRLNVFPIQLPSLRERQDDIPVLTEHFVRKVSKKLGKPINVISDDLIDQLKSYPWPGNIRELENLVERAVILASGTTLQIDNFEFTHNPGAETKSLESKLSHDKDDGPDSLEDMERVHILKTLHRCAWKIKGNEGAAAILKLNPSTLRSRIKKLGIKRP